MLSMPSPLTLSQGSDQFNVKKKNHISNSLWSSKGFLPLSGQLCVRNCHSFLYPSCQREKRRQREYSGHERQNLNLLQIQFCIYTYSFTITPVSLQQISLVLNTQIEQCYISEMITSETHNSLSGCKAWFMLSARYRC